MATIVDPLSSPERVKIKYSGNAKRKRAAEQSSLEDEESESESPAPVKSVKSVVVDVPRKKPASKRPTSSMQPPESPIVVQKRGSKNPAGPPSKRPRRSESPDIASTGLTTSIGRKSSISSMNSISRSIVKPPTTLPGLKTTPKKISAVTARIIKAEAMQRVSNPDAVVEPSTPSPTKSSATVRRTESERIAYFEAQELCAEFEKNRAKCRKCEIWINLRKDHAYMIKPWETHRRKCDGIAGEEEDNEEDPDDAASTVAHSLAPSVSASVRSAAGHQRYGVAERKIILETDPRTDEVRPRKIHCRKCDKWIPNPYDYALANWQKHQNKCSDDVPSSRVARAESMVKLINDAQAKTHTPRSVECARCSATIILEGAEEYDLTKWEEHKSSPCALSKPVSTRSIRPKSSRATPGAESASGRIKLKKTIRGHAPTSSVSVSSADGTVVASTSTSTSPQPQSSNKRPHSALEEEESTPTVVQDEAEEEATAERPTNRPRTDAYKAPDLEPPPGALGWFLLPFRAFIRGFKGGLNGMDSEES